MIKDAINSVINWNYFCLNFNSNFIEECWKNEHHVINNLNLKFIELYENKGTGLMPFFFVELDRENQIKLTNWVNENYISWADLKTQ